MPKATVAGASVADEDGVCRTFEPLPVQHGGAQPPVATGDYELVAVGDYEERGEGVSAGNSSSGSIETPGKSSLSSSEPHLPPVPTTESPSPQTPQDASGADTTTTSTTESGTTSPDDGSATAAKGRKR